MTAKIGKGARTLANVLQKVAPHTSALTARDVGQLGQAKADEPHSTSPIPTCRR